MIANKKGPPAFDKVLIPRAVETKAIPDSIKRFQIDPKTSGTELDSQECKRRAKENKTISKLLEERIGLSQGINKLLPIIERYIEKYYPLEEICLLVKKKGELRVNTLEFFS